MAQITYYTILIGKRASLVTYAEPHAYETKLFPGSFADPGEASQQFKKFLQGKLEYLTEGIFNRKVGMLAYRYKQDLLKLQDWNLQGQHATAQRKGTTPMTLTNEQYINNLPVSALEQTEECLQQDLALLQENDLPVSDTVASLLAIHARLQG